MSLQRSIFATWLPWIAGIALLIAAIALPFVVERPRFWLPNIGVRSMWLGIIAMSMVFLNRFVGLLSLAQVGIAGACAYGLGYVLVVQDGSFWMGVGAGLAVGTLAAFITAVIAARTRAIYFLMITLAMSQVLYSWAGQAIEITNARRGLAPIVRPAVFGLDLSNITTFYYAVVVVAILCYAICRYMARSNFGLTLQGIRDSPERMRSLGYNINTYRILAVTFAGFIASIGGIVMALDRAQIDPDAVSLNATIDVLIVAVVGGVGSLGGVFAGGIILTMLSNFGQNFTEYYVSVMGLVFILILFFAPEGIAGIGKQLIRLFSRQRSPQPEDDANEDLPFNTRAGSTPKEGIQQ